MRGQSEILFDGHGPVEPPSPGTGGPPHVDGQLPAALSPPVRRPLLFPVLPAQVSSHFFLRLCQYGRVVACCDINDVSFTIFGNKPLLVVAWQLLLCLGAENKFETNSNVEANVRRL